MPSPWLLADSINFFDFLVRDDDGVLMGLLQKGDTSVALIGLHTILISLSLAYLLVVYEICICACFVLCYITGYL